MARTFIVIPTYNEAECLPKMMEALFRLPVEDMHVLVIDDDSPDGTGRIAEQLRQRYHNLHVLHRAGKRGLGLAYLAGFRYALRRGADYVVQMDCDFSHSPSYVPEMLDHMDRYDVVVGSRYTRGGELDRNWSFDRHLLSWWANAIYARLILGIKVKDATAGFKCWSRRALSAVLWHPIRSNGYIFQVEMAYVTEKLGFRVLEIPIYFEERVGGESKMTPRVKIEAAIRTWQIRWLHRSVRPVEEVEVRSLQTPRTEVRVPAAARVELPRAHGGGNQ